MTNLFLAVLLSHLPLHGYDVYKLDIQVRQLGERPELGAAIEQFRSFGSASQQQKRKLAAVAAMCDLPARNLLPSITQATREDLQLVLGEYLSLPPRTNSTALLTEFADAWKADWPAGPIEESALKRLTLFSPEKADEFVTKLHFKEKDSPALLWYQWRQLRIERRKARAAELEKKIRPEIEGSSIYDASAVTLELPWPQTSRFAVFVWPPQQQKWFLTLMDRPASIAFARPENWAPPSGKSYQRSWQLGPSWQVTFEQSNGKLTRRCTYVEDDSYVAGSITPAGFTERIIAGESVGPIRIYPAAAQRTTGEHTRRRVLK